MIIKSSSSPKFLSSTFSIKLASYMSLFLLSCSYSKDKTNQDAKTEQLEETDA